MILIQCTLNKNKLKNVLIYLKKKLNLAKLEIWDAESMLKIKIRKRDIKNIALNIFFIISQKVFI
jgi:hypothetical protein